MLILDEPTRGVDVGAKEQIHASIIDLANQGMAVLLISSDLPEVLALSDRVAVVRDGQARGHRVDRHGHPRVGHGTASGGAPDVVAAEASA